MGRILLGVGVFLFCAPGARAAPCAADAKVTDLKPGSVFEMKRPLEISEKTLLDSPYHAKEYIPEFIRGVPSDGRGVTDAHTELHVKGAATRPKRKGFVELPPFRCVVKGDAVSEREWYERTGARGRSNIGTEGAAVVEFEASPDCPITRLATYRSSPGSTFNWSMKGIETLREELGIAAGAKNPLFAFETQCYTEAERKAARRAAKEAEEKKEAEERRRRFSHIPASQADYAGNPCKDDDNLRNLNPGGVIKFKGFLVSKDHKFEDQAKAGSYRIGASFDDAEIDTFHDTGGAGLFFEMPFEKATKEGDSYRIPPFTCEIDSRPVRESDVIRGAAHGKSNTTVFYFRPSPDCPVRRFKAAGGGFMNMGSSPTYADLAKDMGPYFTMDVTCGVKRPAAIQKKPPTRFSTVPTYDVRDFQITNRLQKNLPDATGRAPLIIRDLPSPAKSGRTAN